MSGALTIFDPNQQRDDPRDEEIKELREENKKLARALRDANVRAERAEEDTVRALTALRRQLGPLYRALQAVFGELDAAGVGDEAPSSQGAESATLGGRSAREMALWADWKTKLPSVCARVIDVLLLHSDLSVRQIMAAGKLGEQSVYKATSKLGQLKLIDKTGGRFSLKEL